jgi:integrase
MARKHTGSILKRNGKIYARLTYTGADGKRHDLTRRATDRADAKRIIKGLLDGLESKGEKGIEATRVTFRDLSERYSAVKVKPAEYRNDRKIAGMRDHVTVAGHVGVLVEYFGPIKLRSLTAGQIEQFKQARLATPVRGIEGKERSIANVNRTLATLRSMLRFAVGEGWIDRSPFEMSHTSLISQSDEVKRVRVLSRDKESRIMQVCGSDSPRAHLLPVILCALDTGMRRGEMRRLEWPDVDFSSRTITVRAMNTKTLTARVVPVSSRLLDALQSLYNERSHDGLVFGSGDFKRSWRTACKLAGIVGCRFHDLRATFATRLISVGMQVAEVAKITGHSNLQTLYAHYLRVNGDAVERVASLLDRMNGG